MTREETKAILSVLKAAYPQFYKDKTKEELTTVLDLWSMMFSDETARIVTEAVKALLTTLKFPPTIADVKEKINLITQPQKMTEIEAWNTVYKAINYYNAGENFEKLPAVLQKLVGSPGQLREWAQMDGEVVRSVIQSNFMRSYAARVKSDSQIQQLPESTKNLIAELSGKLSLEGGHDE